MEERRCRQRVAAEKGGEAEVADGEVESRDGFCLFLTRDRTEGVGSSGEIRKREIQFLTDPSQELPASRLPAATGAASSEPQVPQV